MKRRPLLIWIVGLALVLAPLYYIAYVQLAWPASRSFSQTPWGRVGVLNLIGIAAAPVVGALVLRVRPVGWYALLAYVVFTVIANAFTYQVHQAPGRFLLFSGAGLACVLVFLRREIKSPYFNPRMRWWETATRFRLRLGAKITGRESFSTTTFDISDRGCFLATGESFRPGERVDLTLDLGGATEVHTPGTVAWVSDGAHHPKGVGIRFDRPSAAVATELKRYRARKPRYEVALPVKVEATGKATQSCTTFDVSRTGCFVETETPLPPGDKARLTFQLATGLVSLDGEVVWVGSGEGQPRGMGMKFMDQASELTEALKWHERERPQRAPLSR